MLQNILRALFNIWFFSPFSVFIKKADVSSCWRNVRFLFKWSIGNLNPCPHTARIEGYSFITQLSVYYPLFLAIFKYWLFHSFLLKQFCFNHNNGNITETASHSEFLNLLVTYILSLIPLGFHSFGCESYFRKVCVKKWYKW